MKAAWGKRVDRRPIWPLLLEARDVSVTELGQTREYTDQVLPIGIVLFRSGTYSGVTHSCSHEILLNFCSLFVVRPSTLVVLLVQWSEDLVLDGDGGLGGSSDYSGLLFKIEKLTGKPDNRMVQDDLVVVSVSLFALELFHAFAHASSSPLL
jgi:hypothetical protein